MPIKITISGANPGFPTEIMGNSPVEVWKLMSQMIQLIAVTECGNCQSGDLKPEVRHVKGAGNEFDAYGWRCNACGSNLGFGVNKEGGGLFLKWNEEWFKPTKKDDAPPI